MEATHETSSTDALPTIRRNRVSYHRRSGLLDRGSARGGLRGAAFVTGGQRLTAENAVVCEGPGEVGEGNLAGWHG